ncbi:MAG: hypothetical protein RJA70_1157 [Pseudomonadota bacterium]|jgi:hypothetical protein
MLKDLKVSRRFALRGAVAGVGVSLWLPVMDVMCNDHGTAFAQGGALPTSFGIFFWGNGVRFSEWTPKTAGSGDAWQLSPTLQSFAPVKESMTLVSGLDMMDGGFRGHGAGVCYVLAGGNGKAAASTGDLVGSNGHDFETSTSTQGLPTIDQTIAGAIGGDTPYSSLETGVVPYIGKSMGTVSANLAHRGPYDFLPPERDPRALFDRLFSKLNPNPTDPAQTPMENGPSAVSMKLRRSVLDAVLDDAAKLRNIVGANDAARLDGHMEAIRAVEQRLVGSESMPLVPGLGCSVPPVPAAPGTMTERSQSMNRLVTMALACNLTRVYTHLWSGARDDSLYPDAGINAIHHGITHGGSEVDQSTVERYIVSQLADLATVMKDTPMGASNVLHNTLNYGITDVSNPRNHNHNDYHIILMGHAGGKIKGNQHIRLERRKVTELMLTMMQTMGLPIENFGTWDNTSTTIPEILV